MAILKEFRNVPKELIKRMLAQYFVKFSSHCELQVLGSSYGSWTIDVSKNLTGMLLISGGLGEDASFDLEFISKFGSKVVLVDPTDRAEQHFWNIYNYLGHPAKTTYSTDGNQPISAYDLSQVNQTQISFIKMAFWESKCLLKLYPPKNPSHVSFGLKRTRRGTRKSSDFLWADAISVQQLIEDLGIRGNFILKLDIEGAEIATIHSLLDSEVRPQQILVEFEYLSMGNLCRFMQVVKLHKRLLSLGYELVSLHLSRNATYRQI